MSKGVPEPKGVVKGLADVDIPVQEREAVKVVVF
nr:MAG TPA: hypothetical protein [Caudoviricetes sp.]